jgi:hypothetical protein
VYVGTCSRKEITVADDQWVRLNAEVARSFVPLVSEWKVVFGQGGDAEVYEGQGLVFFDEETSTLEIRLVVELDSGGQELEYSDGEEYGRPVQLFTLAQMEQLGLVATMARFRELAKTAKGPVAHDVQV